MFTTALSCLGWVMQAYSDSAASSSLRASDRKWHLQAANGHVREAARLLLAAALDPRAYHLPPGPAPFAAFVLLIVFRRHPATVPAEEMAALLQQAGNAAHLSPVSCLTCSRSDCSACTCQWAGRCISACLHDVHRASVEIDSPMLA